MPRNRRRRRHQATIAPAFTFEPEEEENARAPLTVPIWWVTSFAALFLLPVCWVFTRTFFTCFAQETLHHGFWITEEFWFFSLGSALMTIAFFGLPKPVIVYVFGHELTHAIWVILMGGNVTQFKVTSDGGHIVTDRTNIWIALSPYFYPIYSMLLLVIYGIFSCFMDVTPYHPWFFGLLGATWTFHACFTLWMIPKGQSDITYYGTFFSLTIIYLINLIILSGMLIIGSPRVTFHGYAHVLLHEASRVAHLLWSFGEALVARL